MRSRLSLLLLCAVLPGLASTAKAQSGYALHFFPYQCKQVRVPLGTPDGPFTLEAWARFEGDVEMYGFYTLLEFGDDQPFVGIAGDAFRVMSKDGVVVQTDALPAGAWRHVAYTFDGTTSRLYVGGVEVASSTVAPPSTGDDLGIGCHLGDTVWPGYIDEVMVWNRARTGTEIASDMAGLSSAELADTMLLAYFKFDEGSGQMATNAKVGGPNGTLGSSAEVEVTDPIWVAVSTIPTSTDGAAPVPSFQLSEAHPNPAGARASFTLAVAQSQAVRVAVYDALGREVALLHDGVVAAGVAQTFTFGADALPGGVYFVRAEGETTTASRHVTLVR